MLWIALTGTTSAMAVNCGGFATLLTSVQAGMGEYVHLLEDKNASEREICAAMKRLFRDADVMLKSDYASCIPKQYTPWVVEVGASVQDFKKDDFKAFKCSRYP